MIIIPARLKSSRFVEKILRPIGDVPMFIATARRVEGLDRICIAVDEESVLEIAKNHGFDAILTQKNHESGTDRINEACALLGLKDDELIINVQADEPLIERENVLKFRDFALSCEDAFMMSCYKRVEAEQAQDANLVKVVCDKAGFALYFSRAKIPYERESFGEDFRVHLGIYAYRVRALREFCSWEVSALERAEKLEQLRALENGKKIKMLEIKTQSVGIDTLEDYERVLRRMGKNPS